MSYHIHYREHLGQGRYEVGYWPDKDGGAFVVVGLAYTVKGAEEIRLQHERMEVANG